MMYRFFVFLVTALYALPSLADEVIGKTPLGKTSQGLMITEPVGVADYLQMILGLGVVIALIVGMAWFMRRMGNLQASVEGPFKILGGLSMGQRERIVLVQVGETQILLGVSPGRINKLHVLEQPLTISKGANQKISTSFAERLSAVLKGQGKQ